MSEPPPESPPRSRGGPLEAEVVCVECGGTEAASAASLRCSCGGTLAVRPPLPPAPEGLLQRFDARLSSRDPLDRSGVWRFRELILPDAEEAVVTAPEGGTNLYRSPALSRFTGLEDLALKHEGENPTGSFKDRGMTVGITVARLLGRERVACASTGNTSASMAAYAARAGLKAFVFVPSGGVSRGKLAQALAYGARTLEIEGDFDRAMALVLELSRAGAVYLLNSINPWRIEGQKAIAFEILQDRGWDPPDWLVVPGGNLGHGVALAKGCLELHALGLIRSVPRLAVVQAAGAAPLKRAFETGEALQPVAAETVASAIKIGNPVSWRKSLRAVERTGGTVTAVTDEELLHAKAAVDAAGIGAEPASCAAVAGVRRLVAEGTMDAGASAVGVLTGHLLKDTETTLAYHYEEPAAGAARRAGCNPPRRVAAEPDALLRALDEE